MKTTLKTIGGLNPELVDGGSLLPDEILMKIEEYVESGPQGRTYIPEGMETALLTRAATRRFQNQFGKWLPKGADRLIQDSMEGLNTLEEKYSAISYAVNRQQGLNDWMTSLRINRINEQYPEKEETSKVKGKWEDATVYELPPLISIEGNRKMHEPSRFILKLPDGEILDLGTRSGLFEAKMYQNPNQALYAMARRKGLKIRGGAFTILKALTGLEDITPTYLTVWKNGKWLTRVGWQLNAKDAPSSFLMSGGRLTPKDKLSSKEEKFYAEHPEMDERNDKVLTVSDMDYHLLTGAGDIKVKAEVEKDEDGEDLPVIDYIEGEEYEIPELELSDYRQAIQLDNLDEDEDNLMNFLRANMDFSQFQQGSWGLLESREADQLLIGEKDFNTNGDLVWKTGVRGAKHRVSVAKMLIAMKGSTPDLEKFLERSEESVVYYQGMLRARRRIQCRNDLSEFISHQDPGVYNLRGTLHGRAMREPIKTEPQMLVSPTNLIPEEVVHTAKSKPTGRKSFAITGKVGDVVKVVTANGIKEHTIKGAPKAPLSLRNASKTLRAKLADMVARDTPENREAAAQKEFARVLEMMLN